jgi:hypothetical protein
MKIEKELIILNDRLEKTNGLIIPTYYQDLLMKTATERRDLEKTITETENTKNKVLLSSLIFA